MTTRVLIQARMSSTRFPGKMLAPLQGSPLIAHVIARVSEAVPKDRIVVVTSTDQSDDPLALYVKTGLGIALFRGHLNNVVRRFQDCMKDFPAERFMRVCGDSPVIDPALISAVIGLAESDESADLTTNVRHRTFPPGQSLEVVKTSSFLELDSDEMTAEEREHATLYYYHHPERFKIKSLVANDPVLVRRRLVVDTLDDLRHIENVLMSQTEQTRGYANYLGIKTE